ncbi:MAG: hypothetical protein QF789_00015 [Gammaproteobacteria bacterium]|nr:hypothetical protein [Gammaproteobacteria bacterium]MDP7659580.1 hypothetical protein [Gammaproteobacteria bacterium]
MWIAAGLGGRRSGIGCMVCIGLLTGTLAHADTSGWGRFIAKFSGNKSSSYTQAHFQESQQPPDIAHVLEEDSQPVAVESIIRYYASQLSMQQASFADSYFDLGHFMRSGLHGSFQFSSHLSPFDTDMATSHETDVMSTGPHWTYVGEKKVEISALTANYWVSQTNGMGSISGGDQTVLAADTLLPIIGLSLSWNLSTNLQFTLNGDYLSIYYEDSDGSIINLWAGLRYNFLDSVGIGIGYDMLEVDVESADLSFLGLIDDDRRWGPKAFLTLRF